MSERTSIFTEFFLFLKENKAYWIAPIVIVALALLGLIAFVALSGGAAAPFVYTFF